MTTRSALLLAFVMGLLAFVFDAALCSGCSSGFAERQTARAAVSVSAEAVKAFDVECARVVRGNDAPDVRALARRCVLFYDSARPALVGAGVVVDAWGDVDTGKSITCTVANVGAELAVLSKEMVGKGGRELPIVADALSLVGLLGRCAETPDASTDAGGDR